MCMILSRQKRCKSARRRSARRELQIGREAVFGKASDDVSTEPFPFSPGIGTTFVLGRSSGSPSIFPAPSHARAQWRIAESSGLQQRGATPDWLNNQRHRLPVSPVPRKRGWAPKTPRVYRRSSFDTNSFLPGCLVPGHKPRRYWPCKRRWRSHDRVPANRLVGLAK